MTQILAGGGGGGWLEIRAPRITPTSHTHQTHHQTTAHMSPMQHDGDLSPLDAIKAARSLRLAAETNAELDQVERFYRKALTSKTHDDSDEPSKKKRKSQNALSRDEYRQASEQLALLLCQSSRCKKAKKPLMVLGFTCRLAEKVLDYPSFNNECHTVMKRDSDKLIPCQIIDGFSSVMELDRLRMIFSSRTANYWTAHNYRVEPPSPYFSYVIPLAEIRACTQPEKSRYGFIGDLIEKTLDCPILTGKFPALSEAKYVEMWAHNRPHASGHQLHFDSDDEGRGGVRNPIISTILYITADDQGDEAVSCTGGPSLVTNQKVDSEQLASHGWLSHPRSKRLVAFDGRYLHGVIPGKGVCVKDSRRVTLMFAFWKELKVRRGIGPGSARPFPVRKGSNIIPEWAKMLTDPAEEGAIQNPYQTCKESTPIELNVIYERLDGKPWRKAVMPSYDEVFQGF